MSDEIKAAIIGAVAALVVTFIKDVVIDEIRAHRQAKKALIDRRLAELYSPLWVVLGGGGNGLGNILADDFAYSKLTSNFHLLSSELRRPIEEFMKLGTGDIRHPKFSADELKRTSELQTQIVDTLRSEMSALRKKYYGF